MACEGLIEYEHFPSLEEKELQQAIELRRKSGLTKKGRIKRRSREERELKSFYKSLKDASLSRSTVKIIKAKSAEFRRHLAASISQSFFQFLYQNYPETSFYLKRSKVNELFLENALSKALSTYVSNIDEVGKCRPLLQELSHRIVALSVTSNLYFIVYKSLTHAGNSITGKDLSCTEFGLAWREAVIFLIKTCMETGDYRYLQVQNRKGGWKGEREFRLIKKYMIAEDTLCFDFVANDSDRTKFDFTPGQYLTIRCPGISSPRHYTITSSPCSRVLQCTTRLISDGIVSKYMHTELNVQDCCLLAPPSGSFSVTRGNSKIVLISAGIGITCMTAILRSMPKRRIKAVYHVDKTPQRHAFLEEFNTSGLDCTFYYTYPDTPNYLRPNLRKVAKSLIAKAGSKAEYYLCGPENFMTDMRQHLYEQGVKPRRVFIQHYQ